MPDELDNGVVDSGLNDGLPALLRLGLIFFALFFLLVLTLMAVGVVKRYRAAKAAGLDPFAADVQLMGRATSSALLAPERTLQERLAEVDALAAAGSISAAEHDAARARILGNL